VFKYGDYFYLIIPRDRATNLVNLYDHGIALYRCLNPFFDFSDREYLGYVVVNDKTYDNRYLDTPSIPMTDIYRNVYAPEFGNTLYMLYCGSTDSTSNNTQSIAYTTFSELLSRQPIKESVPNLMDRAYKGKISFSFNVQFDTLTDGDPVFSVGATPIDSAPEWLGIIKSSGADKKFNLFLGGYRATSKILSTNTPYHIVITEDRINRKIFIDNLLVGTFTQNNFANTNALYLYIGVGYGGRYLDGYVWNIKAFERDLKSSEIPKA
jgi:hypothetical protein